MVCRKRGEWGGGRGHQLDFYMKVGIQLKNSNKRQLWVEWRGDRGWSIYLPWSHRLRHVTLTAVKNWWTYKEACHMKGKCEAAPFWRAANIPLTSLQHTFPGSGWADQPPPKPFEDWQMTMWCSSVAIDKQYLVSEDRLSEVKINQMHFTLSWVQGSNNPPLFYNLQYGTQLHNSLITFLHFLLLPVSLSKDIFRTQTGQATVFVLPLGC